MREPEVILVSGGSRGLGAALVGSLLGSGHTVATFSRSRTPFIERCEAEARDRFHWQAIDALALDEIHAFALGVAKRFGRIDGLVANAAIASDGLLTMQRPDDIHRQIAINLESTVRLTQACVKAMLARRKGAIVNISSINAHKGRSGVAVYSATKAALEGLTRSLAKEVGDRGIRVNAVAPGYLETEMTAEMSDEAKARLVRRTPLGRLGSLQDVVHAVEFLLSDRAAFVTGQTLIVDGGLTC